MIVACARTTVLACLFLFAAGCVPRGGPWPSDPPPGSDGGDPVTGTDAAMARDSGPEVGTDAGPPRSHWGWVLIQDHETVGDGIFAVFYDTAEVPLPPSLLENAATALAGAPGCWVNPLDAYPSTGVAAGTLSFTGLAVSPMIMPIPVARYQWTGDGELLTASDWGFAGTGTGKVAPFSGSDAPPDPMVLSTSVYSAATRTYTATWAPGNGTHVGVVALSPVDSAEAVCLYPDSAGAGMVPAAAIDAIVGAGDDPYYVGALRMRVVRHDPPGPGPGTTVWAIGKSGYLDPN